MPRISEIDLNSLPQPLLDTLEERRQATGEPTWQKVMGHRPRQLGHILDLMGSFAEDSLLPKRARELIVVTVSKANECSHCVGRHSTRLHDAGLPHPVIDAILESDCPGLTDEERAVRDYAVALTADPNRVRDAAFDGLRAHFDESQIVEITLLATLAGFFNAFNNVMQVELDASHMAALAAQRGREAAE